MTCHLPTGLMPCYQLRFDQALAETGDKTKELFFEGKDYCTEPTSDELSLANGLRCDRHEFEQADDAFV